jgi:2-phospho-L-lactate guanylyltransferase
MSPSVWAIIPVKTLAEAKRRLAPVLPDEVRRRLVLTMLEDVLETVRAVPAIQTVAVVTPDPLVAEVAGARGAMVIREHHAAGLNAAARTGLAVAAARGAALALVLPADVPLADAGELTRVIESGTALPHPRVTLVPASDGDGTNALALAPPDALEPGFGPGSFIRHLSRAVAGRLDAQVLQLPGIGADIDGPGDLLRLVSDKRERYSFLQPYVLGAGQGSNLRGATDQ